MCIILQMYSRYIPVHYLCNRIIECKMKNTLKILNRYITNLDLIHIRVSMTDAVCCGNGCRDCVLIDAGDSVSQDYFAKIESEISAEKSSKCILQKVHVDKNK